MKINASLRQQTGKQAKKVRTAGRIPAVVYGHGVVPTTVAVDRREFERLYAEIGESTLVELLVEKQPARSVLIHEVQHDFLTDRPQHIDFYQVDMHEKIKARVGLVFSGESKAVKDLGGILVKNLTEVEVECLPGDLPPSITVDTGFLVTFEDIVHISELPVDVQKVKILARPEDVVAKVMPPRSEAELQALEEKPVEEVSAVEGVVKETPPVASAPATEEPAEKT